MSTAVKGAPRAVADLAQGTILAAVEVAAPQERVFRALTTEEVTRWWGSPAAYQTTDWTADLRPGGKWRSAGRSADAAPFSVEGEYVEVDPPNRLVHTWKADWDSGRTTTVTWRLEPTSTGPTRVTLRHDGFAGRADSCAAHAEGWERVLGWLGDFVAPAPARRYFLCHLVPPRPTFAMDMDAAEKAAMRAHADYWRELSAKGTAVVFGPVADPKGAYGLGVLEVADEAEVAALKAADPAIVANIGLRYETFPFVTAIPRA